MLSDTRRLRAHRPEEAAMVGTVIVFEGSTLYLPLGLDEYVADASHRGKTL